jgi:hypothetical protein
MILVGKCVMQYLARRERETSSLYERAGEPAHQEAYASGHD